MGGRSSTLQNSHLLPANQKLVGLSNLANSCSFASVLQALFHLPCFQRGLNSIRELFASLDAFPRNVGYIEPRGFISALRQCDRYSEPEQQDAHEFFSFLLQRLPDSLTHFFQGTAKYVTTCLNCNHSYTSSQSFIDIPIEMSDKNLSLSAIVNDIFVPESMSNDDAIHCSNCNQRGEGERVFALESLPPVLILHLKRFRYHFEEKTFTKISKKVNIPSMFSLRDTKFYLHSCIIHVGQFFFQGHYIAVIRLPNSSLWAVFDDDRVEIIFDYQLERYFGSIENCHAVVYMAIYQQHL
ncbi:hypothetical protein GEMRC1_006480 [Eukaryota sp. GEM-RC1]